jgi:sec-independent protein translocase protein TatB
LFLFILESIGTSELILIAIVALIVFGPRRLPEMAKKAAKMMAEFKNASSEFKSTWEKEVAFESEIKQELNEIKQELKEISIPESQFITDAPISNSIAPPKIANQLTPAPQVRELSQEDIAKNFKNLETSQEAKAVEQAVDKIPASDKRDWL